jgi:hypothetical protein
MVLSLSPITIIIEFVLFRMVLLVPMQEEEEIQELALLRLVVELIFRSL